MIISPLWTPENIARMTKLWSAGKSASFIGTVLGCSRNACIGKIHRLGLNRAPRVADAPPLWDPKDVKKLQTLFASEAKFTFAEMAAVLGMSKGAVSGELSRLGLRRTAGTARAMLVQAKPRPKPPAAVSEPHNPIVAHGAVSTTRLSPLAGSGGENEPAPILASPVTIAELEDHHCRWPVTMISEPMRYCGGTKVLGSSYCASHAKTGAGPGTVAERKALRTLGKVSGLTGAYG